MSRSLLLVLITSFSAIGCAHFDHLARVEVTGRVDFRDYTERGFLFTTGDYTGSYESLGFITVLVLAEGTEEKDSTSTSRTIWKFENVTYDDAIQLAYSDVVEMGGDAMIKLAMEPHVDPYFPTRPGVIVTGFAIKRQ